MGITTGWLKHRLRPGGPWQLILPRTYLTFTGAPSPEQREMAAQLYAGAGSVVTGPAALRRHWIRCPETSRVDVLVGTHCGRASREFVVIHRTRRMPTVTLLERGVAITQPARAVVDAVADMTRVGDARTVIASAVQERRCRIADLYAELWQGPRRSTALMRQVLAEVEDGIRSAPEGDLRSLVITHRLPMPLFNPRLYLAGEFLASPDAWWPAASLAVEVDSVEWHLSPEEWQATMRRHDRMTAAGILVLHVTPGQLRAEPDRIARDISAALVAGRPLASITARPSAA